MNTVYLPNSRVCNAKEGDKNSIYFSWINVSDGKNSPIILFCV